MRNLKEIAESLEASYNANESPNYIDLRDLEAIFGNGKNEVVNSLIVSYNERTPVRYDQAGAIMRLNNTLEMHLGTFDESEIKGLCYFANQIDGVGGVVTPNNLKHVMTDALLTYFVNATFTYAGAQLMVKFINLLK